MLEKNAKVSLEVGFGSGENLLNLICQSDNKSYFIGCEPYLNGLASFIGKLDVNSYKKIKLYKNDVRELLSIFPEKVLDEIFILFPDPWPKARHEKRRIVNKQNINLFLSCLKSGGKIYIATDVKNYLHAIMQLFDNTKEVEILNTNHLHLRPNNIISTRYERKALKKDKKPYYIEIKKKFG